MGYKRQKGFCEMARSKHVGIRRLRVPKTNFQSAQIKSDVSASGTFTEIVCAAGVWI